MSLTDIQIDIDATLARMAADLKALGIRNPLMIGIHTGGAWLAEALHAALGLSEPLGSIGISFYRDDFTRLGLHPQIKTSNLPVNIEDRHVILVDDVLHTGRTIRAALNEIFDYGRPASVTLAVLLARDGRELPIEAHVVGETVSLNRNSHVKLTRDGEGRLGLKLQEVSG